MRGFKYLLGLLVILYSIAYIIELKTNVVPFDWQVKTAIVLLLCLIILCIYIFFYKSNLVLNTVFMFLLLVSHVAYNEFPTIKTYMDIDSCYYIGICKEGIEVDIDGDKFLTNKNNCIKHNLVWDDKNKSCNVRKGRTLQQKKLFTQ